jgi:hypothetical protein
LWFDATDDELREYIQKIFLETVVLDESWKDPRFNRRDAILCSAGLFFREASNVVQWWTSYILNVS